jgi:hypothetical protein
MWRVILIVSGIIVAFAALGVMSAVQDPQIMRYRVAMPGLKAPLRIVQLSDSHASSIDMPAARLRRVVSMMNAQHPDLILLSGDYVSGSPDRWSAAETRAALAPFDALYAPLGVFAVLGNHDDRAKTVSALARTPVRLLIDERIDVGPISLVGTRDFQGGSPAVEAMRRAIRRSAQGKPVLVLVHEPVFFEWLQKRPVLMIAGHTHGGQVKVPFLGSWSTTAFYAAHQRGLFFEAGQWLLVSSGLGTTNLPMRIGVPPEIVELTLVPG